MPERLRRRRAADEKDEKDATAGGELDDEQLGRVAGGLRELDWKGKHYKYVGELNYFVDSEWNASYLCPRCGGPVHVGLGFRFYCDPCDESWYYESRLVPNLASGLCQEV